MRCCVALQLLLFFLCAPSAQAESGAQCPPQAGVALQVLGSGGPIADDGRASSGLLLWHNGRSIALIDAGGGSFLRFAQAGANFRDLELIALTHLHADHSAELPALLKSGYFSHRKRPLPILGPAAGGTALEPFPGLEDFLARLLSRDAGAFAYLAGYLDGRGGLPRLVPLEQAPGGGSRAVPLPGAGSALTVSVLPLRHGIVPALGYRLSVAGISVVFAGDQDGSVDALGEFARHADLLVLNMPIHDGAGAVARALHATPRTSR